MFAVKLPDTKNEEMPTTTTVEDLSFSFIDEVTADARISIVTPSVKYRIACHSLFLVHASSVLKDIIAKKRLEATNEVSEGVEELSNQDLSSKERKYIELEFPCQNLTKPKESCWAIMSCIYPTVPSFNGLSEIFVPTDNLYRVMKLASDFKLYCVGYFIGRIMLDRHEASKTMFLNLTKIAINDPSYGSPSNNFGMIKSTRYISSCTPAFEILNKSAYGATQDKATVFHWIVCADKLNLPQLYDACIEFLKIVTNKLAPPAVNRPEILPLDSFKNTEVLEEMSSSSLLKLMLRLT